jgi:UDP-N-acetylmuramoyl-L-alanyl-D-glutamate--2,6-diaminopimelate ligase
VVDGEEAALDAVRTAIKSPGIGLDHPLLEAARGKGILVIDELELGWRLSTSPVVAVTGTNGKSTTVALVEAALRAGGRRPTVAGNVEADQGVPLSAVPPDHDGWVVAEVSSYQAEGSPEFLPSAAVLTNLTEDHLRRHGSMAEYAAAKRRVFVRGDRSVELAVLNADDAFGASLAAEVSERGGRVLTYGFNGARDYRLSSLRSTLREGLVGVDTPSGQVRIETGLPGPHNAANVAAALALADGLGLAREPTLAALAAAPPVPGRFEPIELSRPFDVIVDFAHSPDGVRQVLRTARELVAERKGRVIVVTASVARTHRATSEALGRELRDGSDHLILTAMSSGSAPRMVALEGVLAGARESDSEGLKVILDRRAAIARALDMAGPGDLVAILGRGSDTRVAFDRRGGSGSFDDRQVVRELLA